MFRIPLQATLAAAGYSVVAVDSGGAAETVLDHQAITVVLSDLGLPDIDGATLAARHPAVPFVLMTGSPPDQLPGAALPPSVMARLIKPFDVTQLTVVLDAAVAAAASRGPSEPGPDVEP